MIPACRVRFPAKARIAAPTAPASPPLCGTGAFRRYTREALIWLMEGYAGVCSTSLNRVAAKRETMRGARGFKRKRLQRHHAGAWKKMKKKKTGKAIS
ncbi:MAG: hypothetical protein LBP19_10045 [Treponema sp.]|nr:hypothetical protein [Treponema sp.]